MNTPIMAYDPNIEPLDGQTILQTIEDCADRIMASLEMNDCDEQILISLNRNEGMFNLAINKETYALKKGEWEKIKMEKEKKA